MTKTVNFENGTTDSENLEKGGATDAANSDNQTAATQVPANDSGAISEQEPSTESLTDTLVMKREYAEKAKKEIHRAAYNIKGMTFILALLYAGIFIFHASTQANKFWSQDGTITPSTYNDQKSILQALMAYAAFLWSLCAVELHSVLCVRLERI